MDWLTLCYPLDKACDHLLIPLPLAFGSAVDGNTYSFRRSFDDTFLAQSTMRDAYLLAGGPASVLRSRRQRAHVEGDIWSMSTI